MDLAAQLRAFRPWNEQEERDREALLRLLENGQAPYGREDPAHLTASAWVVTKRRPPGRRASQRGPSISGRADSPPAWR